MQSVLGRSKKKINLLLCPKKLLVGLALSILGTLLNSIESPNVSGGTLSGVYKSQGQCAGWAFSHPIFLVN